MSGGSLGLRTGSYGSLQQQVQSSIVLPIQTPPTRKLPKMLTSSSREKERCLPWICKFAGRRRVGMFLLVLVSVVVFTSLISALTKDEDVSGQQEMSSQHVQAMVTNRNMRMLPSYDVLPPPPPPSPPASAGDDATPLFSSYQDAESDGNRSSLLSGAQPVTSENNITLSAPPIVMPSSVGVLPSGHPCEHFALPPPPADKKRIGPRPCPVCYLPVDQAMAVMPSAPSVSPVLKSLTYVVEETSVAVQLPEKNATFSIDNSSVAIQSSGPGSPFGGYPSLAMRNESFNIKESMTVHCGFVRGNKPGHQTGFDIDDADLHEMEQCHGIVVASAIFGNYDIIQQPKNISEPSKRNICFFMFLDEETEAYMRNTSTIESNLKVGLWRIIVVRNLPYVDSRRNGKVPKLLLHRLFPNVRYSIWIDGKLELVVDPYQILERFLWRRGYTFAISRHYRRFDVFEEADANKAAGKYDNFSIDAQIEFYRSEGLTPYTPAKLPITSDVPEGCVIIREHIPITNLFTCLWFNEVDRFTSRDQLSFSTVRDKITSKVAWSVYMFLDCERRNFVVQAYHRDLLEHMATIQPPPLALSKRVPERASEEVVLVHEKVPSSPTKKLPVRRTRERKAGSRRHRKVVVGKETNSI